MEFRDIFVSAEPLMFCTEPVKVTLVELAWLPDLPLYFKERLTQASAADRAEFAVCNSYYRFEFWSYMARVTGREPL
jgi:hypothetical protein